MSSSVVCHFLRRHHCASRVRKLNFCIRHFSSVVEERNEKKHELKTEEITKPWKGPFMKNVFLGKFDTDVLAFPEVLESDEIEKLEEKVSYVDQILKRQNSSSPKPSPMNEESLDLLRNLGVFGLQVPREYGGLNLTATEYARYSEVLSQNVPFLISLTAHQAFGLKGLMLAGSEEQKKKYLPLLASGEWTAAFCLAEWNKDLDGTAVGTTAKLSDDEKSWLISGSKIVICDDRKPDLITAVARTEVEEYTRTPSENLSVFLVEKTYPGITIERTLDILGDRGINFCEVRFDKTPVPVQNMLGNRGDGVTLSTSVLNSNRFNIGCICAGILKNILQVTTDYAIKHKEFGKNLMDFESVQEKLAKLTCSIYTMESMTYVTAGLLDMYDNPDTIVEGAIIKVFSSEELVKNIIECQNILGTYKFFEKDLLHSALRSSQVYAMLEGSNNVLRMLIALSGLQHAGSELKDMVVKLRNPLLNPAFVFKKLVQRRNHARDEPKLALGLAGYLHPSLNTSAKHLEYCILKLQYAAEILLLRHGQHICEKEMDVNRLAEIAIGVYAMTAVLARASRSYCIGLTNSELEMQIASTVCHDTYCMVKNKISDIEKSELYDNTYRVISKKVIQYKEYCLEHSLSRTFN